MRMDTARHYPSPARADAASVPAPDTSRNWLGIASLVLGIVGGSVLALVFALFGLRAVREGKATNRGLSLAGLALGSAWGTVLIYAAASAVVSLGSADGPALLASGPGVTAIASTPGGDGPTVPLAQVVSGDCYRSGSGGARPGGGLVSVPGIAVVDCATGHDAEVFYVTTLDGTTAPSDPNYAATGFRLCSSQAATAHIVTSPQAPALLIETYSPRQDGWDRGERYLVCGAVAYGADFRASFTAP